MMTGRANKRNVKDIRPNKCKAIKDKKKGVNTQKKLLFFKEQSCACIETSRSDDGVS
jgi:hypothetical protein